MGLVLSSVAAVSTVPCRLVLCYFPCCAAHLVLHGVLACELCSSVRVQLAYPDIMQFKHGPLQDRENPLFALDLIMSQGVWGLDIPMSPTLAPLELSKIHCERNRLAIEQLSSP